MRIITDALIAQFRQELVLEEKAAATIDKYTRAVQRLSDWLGGEELTKERMLEYRGFLQESRKPRSVNGALTAIRAFLDCAGWKECRVNLLKVQKQMFLDETRELSRQEYERLVAAAARQGKERLALILQTLAGTGIRISELRFFTVEAVREDRICISMKGKNRTVLMPPALRRKLLDYAERKGINSGLIFRTRGGLPPDRSNIAHEMKRLCKDAGVDPRKVFPHSFRHLFARCFYDLEKDIARLADILGHSRIETTRIYVAVSTSEHEQILERMQLVC